MHRFTVSENKEKTGMSKKAMIVVMALVLALSAVVVMAQDSGPGVINVTLPDGKSVPVFTDGRLNAFDIAAPVVVYYTAANGSIVNPNYTSGGQPDLNSLNFSDPTTLNNLNMAMNNGNSANVSGNNASATNGTNATTITTQADQSGLINHLQVLGVGADSGARLVLNASVEDLLSLVTGQQKSLSAEGYSVNFDPNANYFWVQAPADFEGKVYTFAWPNNIFPTTLIGQKSIKLATSQQLNAASTNGNATGNTNANNNANGSTNSNASGSTQATAQPTSQSSNGNGSGQAQPTAQPTSTSP
jgi:hypothetical protein